MKTTKKWLITLLAAAALVIATWAVCEIGNRNHYDYEGYVLDIVEENGETVLITLSGNEESRFILKWYTRASADESKRDVSEGDHIRLSTTLHSDTDIKKMHISDGFSTEGKLIYVKGLILPFLLIHSEETGMKYVIPLVPRNEKTFDGMTTGDTVKVYHTDPINGNTVFGAQIDSAVRIGTDTPELTAEEITCIEEAGYSPEVPQ